MRAKGTGEGAAAPMRELRGQQRPRKSLRFLDARAPACGPTRRLPGRAFPGPLSAEGGAFRENTPEEAAAESRPAPSGVSVPLRRGQQGLQAKGPGLRCSPPPSPFLQPRVAGGPAARVQRRGTDPFAHRGSWPGAGGGGGGGPAPQGLSLGELLGLQPGGRQEGEGETEAKRSLEARKKTERTTRRRRGKGNLERETGGVGDRCEGRGRGDVTN